MNTALVPSQVANTVAEKHRIGKKPHSLCVRRFQCQPGPGAVGTAMKLTDLHNLFLAGACQDGTIVRSRHPGLEIIVLHLNNWSE